MPRLAWFSPLPPLRSGISAYSIDVLPLLTGEFSIDLIVDAAPGAERRREFQHPPGTRIIAAHDFVWRRQSEPYDLTVYQIGNARCHDYMWPYLVHYPGLVVLHDGQVHLARASRLLVQRRFQQYLDELAYAHPETDPELAEYAISGLSGPPYYLWPMLRGVVTAARMVAVHNRWLQAEIREQFPQVLTELVEMGVPDPLPRRRSGGAAIRARHHLDDNAIVFAAYGVVTPEKRIEAVLDAWPALMRMVPHARLLVVGDVPSHFDPFAEIAARGLGESVVVTGFVGDEELPDYLDAADVCLCMRWPSAREASASWLRCLAAGKPTVVTDLVHNVHVPTLDPRTWTLNVAPGLTGTLTPDPVAIGVDVLDEVHSVKLALQRLATDPAFRATLGASARAYWERSHTLDQMGHRYRELIRTALSLPAGHDAVGLPARMTDKGSATLRRIVDEIGVPFRW